MKKLLLATAAVAMVGTPAFAASTASQNMKIKAHVPNECALQNPQNVNLGNIAVELTAGPNALTFGDQSPNSPAIGKGNSQQIWASCNYAASITLKSDNGGLLADVPNDGPDSADFTNKLGYTLSFQPSDGSAFNGLYLQVWNGQITNTKAQTGAFHDDANLGVYINAQGNTKRPLAGHYTDTVHITLGAI